MPLSKDTFLSPFIKIGDALRQRPRLFIPLLAAMALLILVCLIAILLIMGHNRKDTGHTGRDFAESFAPMVIPGEEIFLPREPDFVPEVLFYREPKEEWTLEDASSYWTDPLEGNEQEWSGLIKTGIDELMENIP